MTNFRRLNHRDAILREQLLKRLENERLPLGKQGTYTHLAAKLETQEKTIASIFNAEPSATITTLLRVADAMDCEVVLVKRTLKIPISERDGGEERFNEILTKHHKIKENDQQRRISRRKEFDDAQHEQSFLSDDNEDHSE